MPKDLVKGYACSKDFSRDEDCHSGALRILRRNTTHCAVREVSLRAQGGFFARRSPKTAACSQFFTDENSLQRTMQFSQLRELKN